jgi:hypothetical protein
MSRPVPPRRRTRPLLAGAALLAALAAASAPVGLTAQDGYPRLMAPERSSQWMRGMGSEELMMNVGLQFIMKRIDQTAPTRMSQPGQPTYGDCLLFVVSLEGDVSHFGRSSEPVELMEGMSGADACESAARGARARGGGTLLPGDMFFPGDAWIPEGFEFTSDMLFGGEVDGLYVVDEILNVAANSRDGLVRETGERWLKNSGNAGNAGIPGHLFVAVLVPSEEREEFTAPASVILLAGERPWGMR